MWTREIRDELMDYQAVMCCCCCCCWWVYNRDNQQTLRHCAVHRLTSNTWVTSRLYWRPTDTSADLLPTPYTETPTQQQSVNFETTNSTSPPKTWDTSLKEHGRTLTRQLNKCWKCEWKFSMTKIINYSPINPADWRNVLQSSYKAHSSEHGFGLTIQASEPTAFNSQ